MEPLRQVKTIVRPFTSIYDAQHTHWSQPSTSGSYNTKDLKPFLVNEQIIPFL